MSGRPISARTRGSTQPADSSSDDEPLLPEGLPTSGLGVSDSEYERPATATTNAQSETDASPSQLPIPGVHEEETAENILGAILKASQDITGKKKKKKKKDKDPQQRQPSISVDASSDVDGNAGDNEDGTSEAPVQSRQPSINPVPGIGALPTRSESNAALQSSRRASRAPSTTAPPGAEEDPNTLPITEDTLIEIQQTLATLAALGTDSDPLLSLEDEATRHLQTHALLLHIKSEYEKLQKLFTQCRKNEQLLIKKCKDVTGQMMSNSVKVQAALKLSQGDRITIGSLKKEVKRAWKMVEAAGEKEQKSKDKIVRLKIEINKMRHQMGTGAASAGATDLLLDDEVGEGDVDGVDAGLNRMMGLQFEQELQIGNLQKVASEKAFLVSQNDQLIASVTTLRHEIVDLQAKLNSTVTDKHVAEKNLASIKDLLAQKKTDEDRNAKLRDKLESTVRGLTDTLTRKEHDLSVKTSEGKSLKEVIARLETMVKEDKAKIDKDTVERDKLVAKVTKLQLDYDQQHIDVTRLKAENQDQFVDLKSWEEELHKYKEEFKVMVRLKDGLAKKMKMLEEAKMEAEGQNHQLTYERDTLKKQMEAKTKEMETLGRERDIAQKNFVRATGATQKQISTMKLADQTKRNLEQEISNYKEEAAKMRKIIYSLEKDRDRHINEASKITVELVAKDEDVKIKDIMLYDARKKLDDFERKLKEQQSLYENVRADRNLYSKNLIESQDEIIEMKRKLKIMTHQIEQLKEELGNKEAALAKQNLEHAKLDKDKEVLSGTIDKLKQQLLESEQRLLNQKAEESKLKHIIDEADAARIKQKKEYDLIVQERDIIGTQLIRRNDEISLLYEKIKIQASTLNKGEIQYRERLEDIRVLRLEIKKLRREKAILQTETQNVEGLKGELFKLQ
ncbi:hypothetical protein HDU99_009572, partial [Rhizoclosmatium hyalinum]